LNKPSHRFYTFIVVASFLGLGTCLVGWLFFWGWGVFGLVWLVRMA